MWVVVALSAIVLQSVVTARNPTYNAHEEAEAHRILKRFAESNQPFTNRDVAHVLHERNSNSFHRISRRDLRSVTDQEGQTNRIRLELINSGKHLHLNLQKRSMFSSDTTFFEKSQLNGRVKRQAGLEDCYATGSAEIGGKIVGSASVALCNGIHGYVRTDTTDYYIHPVEIDSAVSGSQSHRVHILSRRAAKDDGNGMLHTLIANGDDYETGDEPVIVSRRKRSTVDENTYKTATSFVIEMAVFIDAQYFERIHAIAPDREEEYVLMSLATTNSIYSDPEKVGYEARIKIKHFETWRVNPQEYEFQQSLSNNLRSFCTFTRKTNFYDMHLLFTGVTNQGGPAAGMAYTRSVCRSNRCINALTVSLMHMSGVVAHEIGHNLGFDHYGAAKCPESIKNKGSGFMGGQTMNFSPCNKWELVNNLFKTGRGMCLFEETGVTETAEHVANLPKVLEGQTMSPNEQCQVKAGVDYRYFRPKRVVSGGDYCRKLTCINVNNQSIEYRKIKATGITRGFPCADEMFCNGPVKCVSWDIKLFGVDAKYLREIKSPNNWSEWSGWSECSHSCGTGVSTRSRECLVPAYAFLNPYCEADSLQFTGCNQEPCPDSTAATVEEILQSEGDDICQKFFENNVKLDVKGEDGKYLAKSVVVSLSSRLRSIYPTKSCFLKCEREPKKNDVIDAIYPDGTPCTEKGLTDYQMILFGIQLKCVQGACVKINPCPDNQEVDKCGICGGDSEGCVSEKIGKSLKVKKGKTATLASIPAGAKRIMVGMDNSLQPGLQFQLGDGDSGDMVIGEGSENNEMNYLGENAVDYAGTKWQFSQGNFIKADGPTLKTMDVIVKRTDKPVKEIYVTYLLPDEV